MNVCILYYELILLYLARRENISYSCRTFRLCCFGYWVVVDQVLLDVDGVVVAVCSVCVYVRCECVVSHSLWMCCFVGSHYSLRVNGELDGLVTGQLETGWA